MGRYALINTETHNVDNTIEWDGVTEFNPPPPFILVQTDVASTGWSYIDGVFIPPPVIPPTPEEIREINRQSQLGLLSQASISMTPIFLALQLDPDDELTEKATAWRNYYASVQAVDISLENPEWPVAPVDA